MSLKAKIKKKKDEILELKRTVLRTSEFQTIF